MVHGEAIDSTSFRITWSPPPESQQNGVLAGYRVLYVEAVGNKGIDDSSVVMVSVPSADRTYVIRGAHKWTLYNVWVAAFTLKGDGPHSDVIVVQTNEDGLCLLFISTFLVYVCVWVCFCYFCFM